MADLTRPLTLLDSGIEIVTAIVSLADRPAIVVKIDEAERGSLRADITTSSTRPCGRCRSTRKGG